MVKGLRHSTSVCLFLQIVVSDLGSSVEGFLNIAIFQGSKHLIVVIGPDTCEEVGLQLKTHTGLVVTLGILTIS